MINTKRNIKPLPLFIALVVLFRLLAYFWYLKAPSQRVIPDSVRKVILGDSTRGFGLLAVYLIVCLLQKIPVRKSHLAVFCLFGYCMGKSNALIFSWIISSDLMTVCGFLLTGYFGAVLITFLHFWIFS